MSKISRKYKEAYRYELEREIGHIRGNDAFCESTKKAILNHLFGDHDCRAESKFKVVHRYNPYIKCKWWQRVNKLWIYPLFMITIPFQWLLRGETGVQTDSILGHTIKRLIGRY